MSMKFKMFAVVAAVAAATPVFADPSPVLYGGGATLPTIGYVGDSWMDASPDDRLSNPADAGSLFGTYTAFTAGNPAISYCQTGSGTGRGVIIGTKDGSASCPNYNSTPSGFQASTADAHFAASDAPISASEFNTGVTNKGATRGQPVQFPAVAGAIAIIFNNPDQSPDKLLNLTESQICQIFSGQITNWSSLGLPSRTIKLVYRSDSSGTSFGFSNHLSYVCPTADPVGVSGFSTQSTFASAFVGGVVPSGAVSASGNGGVVSAVNSNVGSIGYAEIANAIAAANQSGGTKVSYATVSLKSGMKKKNPAKNPKSFSIADGALISDKVLGSNDSNGRPTLVDLTAPYPGCVWVINPDAYATSVLSSGDYKQYPIVAVSYLFGYYKGYGDDTANVRAFLSAPYNGDIKAATDAAVPKFMGAQTGLSYLGGVNLKKTISGTSSLPACINQ